MLVLLLASVKSEIQAWFNYDSYGKADYMQVKCIKNESGIMLYNLTKDDVIIASGNIYGSNITVNFTGNESTGTAFEAGQPETNCYDGNFSTYGKIDVDAKGVGLTYVYETFDMGTNYYPKEVKVRTQSTSGSTCSGVEWFAYNDGDGYESLYLTETQCGIGIHTQNFTNIGNTTSTFTFRSTLQRCEVPCVSSGGYMPHSYYESNLIYSNGTSDLSIDVYSDSTNNLTLDSKYKLTCKTFRAGYVEEQVKEVIVTTPGSVLVIPKMAEVGKIISGGASFQEVLYEWNPYYYQKLSMHLGDINDVATVEDLFGFVGKLINYALNYILREPATLVPIDMQLPKENTLAY